MANITKEDALRYHEAGGPGKIAVVPTKPYRTQTDLSLAYSPGVAYPCLEIQKNPNDAFRYTDRGNLVAVISNGTAVLGLGNIGALAGKPVMEGKGLLFKIYGGIDVFDIEVDETDPVKFCETVERIAPSFGGINLEDIKAPECFYIEKRLKENCDIPVMHDDQHGTAIISGAGLVNALQINGKKIEDVRIVVSGAGAAAMSCIKMYHQQFLDDDVQAPVMELAAELGVPVLMHAGKCTDPATMAAQPYLSNASQFLSAVKKFPNTTFIQGHIGGGGDWEWNLRTLEEMDSDNYFIDISGSVIDAGIVRRTVNAVGIDHVLFATDCSMEEGVGKVQAADLTDDEYMKLFSGNMKRIFARRRA